MKRLFLSTLLAVLGFASIANAGLIDRGGGLIYDTDLNITWLQNANLAATNNFGVSGIASNGVMTWYTAMAWIAAMNAQNYLGYNNWRLPAAGPDCFGYNCTGSEAGHLYYIELHGAPAGGVSLGPFLNLNDTWTGTTAWDPGLAWFDTFGVRISGGYQTAAWKTGGAGYGGELSAWAVRDGDVTPVPEPSLALLLGLGLGAMCLTGWRFRA